MKKKPVKEHDKESYQSDVLDLLREVLNGITLGSIDFDKKLQGQDRIDFLKFCDYVHTSSYFEMIISNVVFPSLMTAAKEAENYDIVSFNRATANGASLVKEFFQKRSLTYQREFMEPTGKFDPQKSFEPVGPPIIK